MLTTDVLREMRGWALGLGKGLPFEVVPAANTMWPFLLKSFISREFLLLLEGGQFPI